MLARKSVLIRSALMMFSLVVCSGQSCSSVGVLSSQVASPLTPGIYIGTGVCRHTLTGDGELLDDFTKDRQITLTISTSGIPIEDGRELFPGHFQEVTVGGISAELVVGNIVATADGLVVNFDAVMIFDYGAGLILELTGVWTDVYKIEADDVIAWSSIAVLGMTDEFGGIFYEIECSGTSAR